MAAPRTRLAPGESSVQRVADSLQGRGPYTADVSVKLWDGRIKRFKIRAATKGEFRAKGAVKCEQALNAGGTKWTKGRPMVDYIDEVSIPVIKASRLAVNSRKRYLLVAKHLKEEFAGFTIGDAVRFRVLERVLLAIADKHGSESARQSRTVISKYICDQLIREGLIDHNPLRGVGIDLGDVKKTTKPSGGVALSSGEYDAVIDHLMTRDVNRPLPPGTDKRASSIAKHDRVVALAMLQAGTGLRISEALGLTRGYVDIVEGDEGVELIIHVSAEMAKNSTARTIPVVNRAVTYWWVDRLERLGLSADMPLIPSPGSENKFWRADNGVKACADLYPDIGKELGSVAVAQMRSHSWRTVLNNKAIAAGVPASIRARFFGHTVEVNASAYTDLTDVEAMRSVLKF